MIVALLFALAVQDAVPVQTAPSPTAEAAPAKPKKERPICRPIQDTVSRMSAGRECHTAAEWRLMDGGVDNRALDRAKER